MTRDLRVVVVGSGRVGLTAARALSERGHTIVLVERNPERVRTALDEYVASVIEGDAARPSVLEQAGLDRTDVVAALTNTPATNLAVCLAADRLGDVRTVLRAADPEESYDGYVDATVYPESAGARLAVNAIEGGMTSFADTGGDLELIEMRVAEAAPIAGRRLSEVSLPYGMLVVSDASHDETAGPKTEMKTGETYIVAVQPEIADEARQLFRG